MASPEPDSPTLRKRSSTLNSVSSVTQNIASFTGDLVLNRDPAPGFFAATAQTTSKAPTLAEIRRGSFGEEGWSVHQHGSNAAGKGTGRGSGSGSWKRSWSGSGSKKGSRDSIKRGESHGHGPGAVAEPFAPLTEEPTSMGDDAGGLKREEVEREREVVEEGFGDDARIRGEPIEGKPPYTAGPHPSAPADKEDRLLATTSTDRPAPSSRAYSSGYIPPPKIPWTQSTAIALKAFWRWFITPFGFVVTIYGLNVVAWGGMLFLLLCGAAPAMCHAPIPTPENREKMTPVAALNLPGPYYRNCNDINSPRRIWIEIDSQILNALFCVTGLGLVPWRFRDLYYILRYRFASAQKQGLEGKMYGLRVLAGIYKGWFRLPGSETLDTTPSREYLLRLEKEQSATNSSSPTSDLESAPSSTPDHDIRIPLPLSKAPENPVTSIRAPPTKVWLLDFFIWCQIWNTIFQVCLCGFMWGLDRYDRPPWSTGLFIALAFIIAGVGGVVSFVQGRRVKRVEGVAPSAGAGGDANGAEMAQTRTNASGRENMHVGDKDQNIGLGR